MASTDGELIDLLEEMRKRGIEPKVQQAEYVEDEAAKLAKAILDVVAEEADYPLRVLVALNLVVGALNHKYSEFIDKPTLLRLASKAYDLSSNYLMRTKRE